MIAVAVTVAIVSLLYIIVIHWSYKRHMISVTQYKARTIGCVCIAVTMALMIFKQDITGHPRQVGTPITSITRLVLYMLAICVMVFGMVISAVVDMRESLKAYVKAQRELLTQYHPQTKGNEPHE